MSGILKIAVFSWGSGLFGLMMYLNAVLYLYISIRESIREESGLKYVTRSRCNYG